MLITDDDKLWERANLFGQHPMRHQSVIEDPDLKRYIDSLIYTYRIHPLSCAIAGVQLGYLDQWNAERRRNNEHLSAGLKDMPGIQPAYVAPECEHVYHIYSPTFVPEEVEGVSRETYVEALVAEGVPMGLGYVRVPIHLRPRHQDRQYFYGKNCPWSCTHARRDVVYERGDCPVAEHRCEHTELTVSGGVSWRGDQTELAEQIVSAFEKVTGNLDALRDVERQKAAS